MLRLPWYLTPHPLLAVVPLDSGAGSASELTKLLDEHHRYMLIGDVEGMTTLRTKELHDKMRQEIEDEEMRNAYIIMGRAQIPESSQLLHVNDGEDGNSAEIYAVWKLPAMEEIGRPESFRIEVMIEFRKEQGRWKLGHITLLSNPDQINRPSDLRFDESEVDTDWASASLAGRITAVEFNDDHTLVMLRVLDDEIAVFMPDQEFMKNHGMDLADYQPWKKRQFTGYPHKTDKLKFFATGDSAID